MSIRIDVECSNILVNSKSEKVQHRFFPSSSMVNTRSQEKLRVNEEVSLDRSPDIHHGTHRDVAAAEYSSATGDSPRMHLGPSENAPSGPDRAFLEGGRYEGDCGEEEEEQEEDEEPEEEVALTMALQALMSYLSRKKQPKTKAALPKPRKAREEIPVPMMVKESKSQSFSPAPLASPPASIQFSQAMELPPLDRPTSLELHLSYCEEILAEEGTDINSHRARAKILSSLRTVTEVYTMAVSLRTSSYMEFRSALVSCFASKSLVRAEYKQKMEALLQ